MKVLVINGSGKGKNSGTLKIAQAFAKGIKNSIDPELDKAKIENITLADMDIHHCRGCFECWKNEEGKCDIDDEMAECIKKYIDADIVIWSFPLCEYTMSSLAKTFMERLLPVQPMLHKGQQKDGYHEARPIGEKKFVLICASHAIDKPNQFDPLMMQFSLMYPRYAKVLVGQGALLSIPKADAVVKPFLEKVTMAGEEFAKNGYLSNSTEGDLSGLMIPRSRYMQIAGSGD